MNSESALTQLVRSNLKNKNQGQRKNRQLTFYLDVPDLQKPLSAQLQIEPIMQVSQAIIQALQQFKLQLVEKQRVLEIELQYYAPRLAKKNGKPKLDMPCLDIHQKISDIKINTIALQIKNQKALLNKYKQVDRVYSKPSGLIEYSRNPSKIQINQEQIEAAREKQSDCFFSFC